MKKIILITSVMLTLEVIFAQTEIEINQSRLSKHSASQKVGYDSVDKECNCGEIIIYEEEFYPTVQIGKQCWFAKNIMIPYQTTGNYSPIMTPQMIPFNFKSAPINTGVIGSPHYLIGTQSDNSIIEKYCFDADCNIYGGYYQWDEAMQYSTTPGAKGICPNGWHIPTSEEFEILLESISNDGEALKKIVHGISNGTGTNASGFSILIRGDIRHQGENYIGSIEAFWSSTEVRMPKTYIIARYARTLGVCDVNSIIYMNAYSKYIPFNVRCIKNRTE